VPELKTLNPEFITANLHANEQATYRRFPSWPKPN